MSKRKSSFTDPLSKRRKLNSKKSFNSKQCAKNINNAMKSLFNPNSNTNNTINKKANAYHFITGEIKVSPENFLQIFIPSHKQSTIQYQGNNLLSKNNNNKTFKNIYECKEIINESPVGIGDKTVVDKTVRCAKELKSSQFDISGQSFEMHNSRTNNLLKQVKDCLAPHCEYITAMKYKLMIYGKNDFFKSHVDTYRGDGNFGTLLLLLPTQYTGGELILQHNNNKKSFVCSKNDIIKWIAFYGDIKHEILPIISGYRVSISYNLYLSVNSKTKELKEREWINTYFDRNICDNVLYAVNTGNKRGVIFALDHEYISIEMDLMRLKGRDRILYDAMKGCKLLEFKIEDLDTCREEYNGDDEGWYQHNDDDWELGDEMQTIGDDDNDEYGHCGEYVVIGNVYKNKSIDDESGPTGNEGQTRELSYKCSVMIVTVRKNANDNKNTNNSNSKLKK